MFRLFKRYNVSAAYDGIPHDGQNAHKLLLDPVDVAGKLNIHGIRDIARRKKLNFGTCIDMLLVLAVFLSALIAPPIVQEADTSNGVPT